jgi:hypothetical protein
MMDRTNAERQRRYIAKLKARAAGAVSNDPRLAELEEENTKLKAENARLKAKQAEPAKKPPPEPPSAPQAPPPSGRRAQAEALHRVARPFPKTWEELVRQGEEAKAAKQRPEAKLAALEAKFQKAQGRIAQLEGANALQDEIAARDKRIKALTTQVTNLKAHLRMARNFYEEEKRRRGTMPFATYATLMKYLNPQDPTPTVEQRTEAYIALTQWKQANDRTRKK